MHLRTTGVAIFSAALLSLSVAAPIAGASAATPQAAAPSVHTVARAGLQTATTAIGPRSGKRAVREVQYRLKIRGIFRGKATGTYGSLTKAAVRKFQKNQHLSVTGLANAKTLARLRSKTRKPTADELAGRAPNVNWNCLSGRVLCASKADRKLRWMINGVVIKRLDARFGCADSRATRQGVFKVYRKDKDHVSNLYESSMPFAMFFSGGQAVHYSSDFAARGYAGCSHGCVNVRDWNRVSYLYNHVKIGDKVVVYASA